MGVTKKTTKAGTCILLIDTLKAQVNFSDTECVVANYILDNLNHVSEMNISTLAENTFCSMATISRLCKKLKYSNFSAFKLELAAETYAPKTGNERIEYNFPFHEGDNNEQIVSSIVNLSHQILIDSYRNIDVNKIHKASLLLDSKKHIDIYANGNSLVTALDLHNKLLWLGKNSNLELISGLQHLKAQSEMNDRAAIIISYYGTDERNINIVRTLHNSNTPYILITGPKLNPLCVHAAVVIQVTPVEEFVNKIAPISSRIAMTYVSDLLYCILFSLNYEGNKLSVSSHLHISP